jgi:hypothetical protein
MIVIIRGYIKDKRMNRLCFTLSGITGKHETVFDITSF